MQINQTCDIPVIASVIEQLLICLIIAKRLGIGLLSLNRNLDATETSPEYNMLQKRAKGSYNAD